MVQDVQVKKIKGSDKKTSTLACLGTGLQNFSLAPVVYVAGQRPCTFLHLSNSLLPR
jgi:hypothetical protein